MGFIILELFLLILKTIRHQERKITTQGEKLKVQRKGKHSRVQSPITLKKGKLFKGTMLREQKKLTQVNKLNSSTCSLRPYSISYPSKKFIPVSPQNSKPKSLTALFNTINFCFYFATKTLNDKFESSIFRPSRSYF